MFRKSKIEPVEKVKIVERYLAGEKMCIRDRTGSLLPDHQPGSLFSYAGIYPGSSYISIHN